MPLIPVKIPWTRKPTHPVRASQQAIKDGLVACYMLNEGGGLVWDAVSGDTTPIAHADIERTITKQGQELDFTSNLHDGIDPARIYDLSKGFTFVSNASFFNTSNDFAISGTAEQSSPVVQWWNDTFSPSRMGFAVKNSLNNYQITYGATTPTAGVPATFAATTFATTSVAKDHLIYFDGELDIGTQGNGNLHSLFSSVPITLGAAGLSGKDFRGKLSFLLLFNRGKTPAQIRSLTNNPWQVLEPRTIYVPFDVAAGAIELVIQDATHAHTADNLDLTQQNSLVVQDATHAHSADNVVLTGVDVDLVIQESTHAHTADNLDLVQANVLTVQDATHAHLAENVALTQQNQLVIADALHAHAADNLTLSLSTVLEIQGGDHAHTADSLALTQANVLAIQGALHALSSDNVDLTQQNTLVIDDALHTLISDNVTITIPGTAVTPIERTYIIQKENRIYIVMRENRTSIIH